MTENIDGGGVTIGAVQKSLQMVETLQALDGANLTELVEELGWAKSTVYAHLRSLEENEYVVYRDGEYILSFRYLELGEYVKERNKIHNLIEPKIENLADQTGERVQFVINEHGKAVYVRIAEGDNAVSTGGRLGRRKNMLHATAAGKSILASIPTSKVEEIIDEMGLPELTANTITDRERMFDELEEVRERGYAINNEEHITGLRALAVPVVHPSRGILGAISIAGPAHRIQGRKLNDELPNLLLGVKNEIELDIEYG